MAPDDKTDETDAFPVNVKTRNGHHKHHEGLPDDMLCGIGPFKFQCLQSCARMGSFVGVYSVCGLMTSILSMYIVSQITTIEKQYGLSSSQSGLLLSCNDFGYLLTTLLASYFARKVHIPRSLCVCVILYGVAGIVCCLPFFVSKDFVFEQAAQLSEINTRTLKDHNSTTNSFSISKKSPLCNVAKDSSDGTGYAVIISNSSQCDVQGAETSFGVGEPNKYTTVAITFIAIGMIIQGLAKAPRYPFIATYVDDNVNKKNTAMYMGIVSGVGIFGPAIAFAVGGYFSRQYVTLQDVPISPRHPAWIGAWWLGFLVFGVIAIFVSFPLLCFPKRMRPRRPEQKPQTKPTSLKQSMFGFFKSIARLVCNTVYMPLVASTCVTLFAVAGMLAFSAKYLETQFFIPAWKANVLLGVMNIVAASAGTVTGGFIVTKRKLSPLSCVKMLLLVGCLSLAQNCLGFVFGCSNAEISGFNAPSRVLNNTNITCTSMCGCDSNTYFPVCVSDMNYMSPCHAGCQHQDTVNFKDCACAGENAKAIPGLCETPCGMLYPYLINNVFGAFLATLGMIPSFIVMLRSVSELDKSMAVGFSSLLSTLCGWFAGPLVFGRIIDTACIIWSASCTDQGACALYDNDDYRIKKHSFEIVPKVITILLQLLVFLKARRKTDWSVDKPEEGQEKDVGRSMMADAEEMETFS